jgi:ribosomal protein L3
MRMAGPHGWRPGHRDEPHRTRSTLEKNLILVKGRPGAKGRIVFVRNAVKGGMADTNTLDVIDSTGKKGRLCRSRR